MQNSKKIIHITDAIPFHNGGVSDYSYLISKGLKEKFDIETFFVTCNAFTDYDTSVFKNITNIYKEKNLYATVKNIVNDNFRDNEKIDIILEYVPHAYEKRGCPFWLLSELKKIKKNLPNINLLTMFHELYATSSNPKTSTFWLQGVQKYITFSIAKLCDSIFTNTMDYQNKLSHKNKMKIVLQPVFSNIPKNRSEQSFDNRKEQIVIFGSHPSRLKVYDKLDELNMICKKLNIKKIIDIGPGAIEISFNDIAYEIKGKLSVEEISTLFNESKFGLINYKQMPIEKSGIFAAYISFGVIPITMTKYKNDSLYKDGLQYIYFESLDTKVDFSNISSFIIKNYNENANISIHLDNYMKGLNKCTY